MSVFSARNVTSHSDTRPEFSKMFLGLRREYDPRSKCVLMTGNGFTLGLLSDLDLMNQFPCSLKDIFSPNEKIKYIGIDKEDSLSERVLWDSELWPKLTAHLEYLEFDLGKLWQSFINSNNLNHSRNKGKWSIDETGLAFEIRWYIWFYFRNTIKLYSQLDNRRVSKWSWIPALSKLINNYNLSYVTFNYDTLFDRTVRMMGKLVWPVIIEEKESLNKLLVNTIPGIKVHGSLEHLLPRDGMFGGNIKKPWLLSGIVNENNQIINQPLISADSGNIAFFERWPWLPEIVPPGRPGNDLCHPQNIANKYAKDEIDNCDMLIVCGLSANEPDTDEIKELCSSIRKTTKIIHVDIDPENTARTMSEILKNSGCEYIPLKSSELNNLLKYI